MKLYQLVLVSILTMVSGCFPFCKSESAKKVDLATEINNNSVSLTMMGKHNTVRSYCSGSWISDDVILSAAHCAFFGSLSKEEMEDEDLLLLHQTVGQHIYFSSRMDGETNLQMRLGTVIEFDPAHDLALIKAAKPPASHGIAKIGNSVSVGESIYKVGNPAGLLYSFGAGTVASIRTEYDPLDVGSGEELKVIQITNGMIYFGDSGSGLYNDNGELIGVASFLMRGSMAGFYVHRDHIASMLNKYKL